MYDIYDMSLAPEGEKKINWVIGHMPLLNAIKERFEKTRPFDGLRISMSIHLEAKTAYLARVLQAGGAEVWATGCNPLSTQDDVAAALASTGGEKPISVFAKHGVSAEEYENALLQALSCRPHLMIDDGGDFTALLHGKHAELAENLMGGCEETTTGIRRLYALQGSGRLAFPMMLVNDAQCKHFFDNRYGTGQSVWDGIMRTTNLIVAGKTVVIAGYGWCGRGIAMRAKGLGAKVIITEIDPVKALEAAMDGFKVMRMEDAAPEGDVFITATGCFGVIRREHFASMKNGVLLANAGHFDVEIDKQALTGEACEIREMKKNITGYVMRDGRILNLLAEGRLVNLAAGDGHPAEIMDMSFAVQALSLEYIAKSRGLEKKLYAVPAEIDEYVSRLKLRSMGIRIDRLSEEQSRYIKGETV